MRMFVNAANAISPVSESVAASSNAALPQTGQSIALFIIIAVIVLAVGALLIIAGRIRRRKQNEAAANELGGTSAHDAPEGSSSDADIESAPEADTTGVSPDSAHVGSASADGEAPAASADPTVNFGAPAEPASAEPAATEPTATETPEQPDEDNTQK